VKILGEDEVAERFAGARFQKKEMMPLRRLGDVEEAVDEGGDARGNVTCSVEVVMFEKRDLVGTGGEYKRS
jgi:hypothetical protein